MNHTDAPSESTSLAVALLDARRKRRVAWQAASLFAAYAMAGAIGLAIPYTSGNVSPVWPAAGVALAAILVFGYRVWPAVTLAAFLVNFFTPVPHVAAAGIAAGNTLGPLCAAYVLRRLRGSGAVTRLREIWGTITLSALCGAAVSATIGTVTLFVTGVHAWSGFAAAWVVWWLGDSLGVLMVAPAVLAFAGLLARQQSAREALEQREQTYRVIADRSLEQIELLSRAVEQTADSIVVTDRDGTIEYVNPAFELTTGYSRAEAIGQTPRLLKSGFHDEEFYAGLWGRIVHGEPFRGMLVNRKKSGELYWAEQTITPIKDGSGRLTHFVSVLKDMTECRKRQEQEVQLRLAREVQQRFYAGAATSIAGFDVATATYPAVETGGDYLDLFSLPDGRVCVAIGDVSGHGLDSAIVMALTRAYVRAFARVEPDVAQILVRVNQMLCADLLENRFVTVLLVCVDGSTGSLSYAGAGHIPGFVISPEGQIEFTLESSGPPLGLFPESRYCASALPLAPQQLVVLTTDGITEMDAPENEQFGPDGVLDYVRAHVQDSACDLAEGLYRAARRFSGSSPQQDDVTEVVLRVAAQPPWCVRSSVAPVVAASVAEPALARRRRVAAG